jgi:hypothetical protein
MKADYYQVLGVSRSANFITLRQAFRARVMEHHPDRGGSHDAMVCINEAYAILADPLRRRRYDAACKATAPNDVREHAAVDVRDARVHAADYPAQWGDVETWLSRMLDDFTDTRYDEVTPFGSYPLPTAGGSVSGFFFILLGAAAGVMFGTVPLSYLINENNVPMNLYMLLMLGAPLVIGAWAGSHLHRGLGAGVAWARRKRVSDRSAGQRDRS